MTIDELQAAVQALLAKNPNLTQKHIRDTIDRLRPVLEPTLSDDQAEHLARDLEALHTIHLPRGPTLVGDDFRPWLDNARETIDPYYWTRYREHLVAEDFPIKVVSSMDTITDDILDLLGNPRDPTPYDRRGLVVGQVQSGKTANYIALCCKAADAGYRVIIVITGIHTRLRHQTQVRVDHGFIGRDTSQMGSRTTLVGVGLRNSRRFPNPFTHATKDFDRKTADAMGIPLQNIQEPAVFIIKKNYHVLENLLGWLRARNRRTDVSKIDAPMLLIDDEADNASINIRKGPEEVSRINSQIRALLATFERRCYIGYTATPFANIFIEPDSELDMIGNDLFPRHFIKGLDAPSNYYGPHRVFPDDDAPNPVRAITDHEASLHPSHRKEHQVDALPNSLLDSTRAFLVSCAIRRLRGDDQEHKSMLVNASRFIAVQHQIRLLLHDFVDRVRQDLRIHGMKAPDVADRYAQIRKLRLTFETEYADCGHSWQAVLHELHSAVGPIRVIEVNSESDTPLDYTANEGPLNVIAVGGYTLSRGLTLLGLVVSYFLRRSQMYDTLMQMGRWFGYRTGYDDLCRIWMLRSAAGWYSHIARSFDELRDDLRYMSQINAAPKDFGLRVRSHPDSLMVTARNKMGTGQIFRHSVGLANCFVETAFLSKDSTKQQSNRDAVRRLAERLRADGWGPETGADHKGGRLLSGVPFDPILDFLLDFENDARSLMTQSEPLCRYIQNRADELGEWDLYFAGVETETPRTLVDNSLGFRLRCQRRAEGSRFSNDPHTLMVTNKQRVASRGVERTGLSVSEIEAAESAYRAEKELPAGGTHNYPDFIYRQRRTRPLLIVHLLAIGEREDDLSGERPVVAYSISFPRTAHEHDTVEYLVNTTWLRQLGAEDADEDEMDGDDDGED